MTRIVQTLGALTLLTFALPGRAQLAPLPDHPKTLAEPDTPPDPAEAAGQILQTVSQSVISIDSTGDRTSEAIADSTVTLTLAPLPNTIQFRDVCLTGGDRLRIFTQSLTDTLNLAGQVLRPSCTRSGQDSDPFKLEFHLHYEGGGHAFFVEDPLLLPASIIAPEDPSESDDATDNGRDEDLPEGKPEPPSQPQQPILLDPRHIQKSHAVMSLPPGWSVPTPPPPVHEDSPFATFDRTVTYSDGILVTDQQLTIKKDKVEIAEIPAFEKWVQSSSIHDDSWNVSLDSTFYTPDSAFTGKTDDEKQAADLLQQARDAIESKDFTKAQSLLNQAEALDPDHELLHDGKGDLAAARGDHEAALIEYQKELRAFPDVPIEMESIAFEQEALNRNDAAIATLEQWIAGDPNSAFPVRDLMYLYRDMGRDDLAVSVGDQAIHTMNSNGTRSVRFLLLYGQEQERVGQMQAAAATFETLLEYTTDIQLVNEATYLLSEHGLALDRAEETMRASLTQFDPENEGRVHHMHDMDPKQKTSLMLASWDTLGWILYKEGKIKEAEAYIRAAWRSRQDVAIGLHLAQILNAEDKPVDALDQDKLALATIATKDHDKADKDPDVLAIRAAIAQLESEGHTSTITDPAAALTKLRILDAGPAGKLRGESRYQLTLSASGIVASPTDHDQPTDAIKLIDAIKLPTDFFPPDSRAIITKEATLNCTTTCTLTLQP